MPENRLAPKLRPAASSDARAVAEVLVESGVAAWGCWRAGVGRALLGAAEEALRAASVHRAWLNTEERGPATTFYERCGWRRDGSPRVRDWHGARLVEPRYVKDL